MSERLANRVLLIGWDAADWTLLRPMLQAGEMPALAGLIERGASGNLATIHPVLSPMLWTSIATGKRPYKHGIHGFVEPAPDGSGVRPITSTSRTTKAIWNILSQSSLESNVVGWLASHPAEPIRGTVATDYFLHPESLCGGPDRIPADACWPERLRPVLQNLRVNPRDIDAEALLPFVPLAAKQDVSGDARIGQLASLLARAASAHAVACATMSQESWDFTAVYYDMIDQIGHHFMQYHPPAMPGVSAADAAMFGDVVRGCYRFHDMMLQAMLELAGDDATVIIVSDHGFHSGDMRTGTDGFQNPTAWHREQGMVCASGPGIRPGETLRGASLLDVTPTILTLLGLPVGKDMDGRPWLEALEPAGEPDYVDSWDDVPGESGIRPPSPDAVLDSSPEMLQVLADLGYLDAPSGEIKDQVNETRVQLKTNLALAMMDGGEVDGAMALWAELAEDQSQSAAMRRSARAELADCLGRQGRHEQCQSLLMQLRDEAPDDPVLLFKLAQLKLRVGEPDAAIALINALTGPVAESVPTLVLKAQCLMTLRSLDAAAKLFDRVLKLDADNAMAYAGLARAALLNDDVRGAADLALRAIELDTQLPAAHHTLGHALLGLGRRAEARLAWQASLRIDPEQPELRRSLARLGASDAAEHNGRQDITGKASAPSC